MKINNLPKNVSYDEIMEKLFVVQKVEGGLKDIAEGKVISQEEFKKRLAQWLK
jgi:predicted transcriptional regulator